MFHSRCLQHAANSLKKFHSIFPFNSFKVIQTCFTQHHQQRCLFLSRRIQDPPLPSPFSRHCQGKHSSTDFSVPSSLTDQEALFAFFEEHAQKYNYTVERKEKKQPPSRNSRRRPLTANVIALQVEKQLFATLPYPGNINTAKAKIKMIVLPIMAQHLYRHSTEFRKEWDEFIKSYETMVMLLKKGQEQLNPSPVPPSPLATSFEKIKEQQGQENYRLDKDDAPVWIEKFSRHYHLPLPEKTQTCIRYKSNLVWKCSLKLQVPKYALFDQTLHSPSQDKEKGTASRDNDSVEFKALGAHTSAKMARLQATIHLAQQLYDHVLYADAFLKQALTQSPAWITLPPDIRQRLDSQLVKAARLRLFQPDPTTSSPTSESEGHSHPHPETKYSYCKDIHEFSPSSYPRPTRFSSDHLPVNRHYQSILNSIQKHQITIISGATGSGKTTQIPQMVLEHYDQILQQNGDGKHLNKRANIVRPHIVVTQPRRIAAISVAKRVAQERGEEVGKQSCVGFQVRFNACYPTNNSRGTIVYCTTGILLKRLQTNLLLSNYTHLIIDEVHERDINTDTLLALFRDILPQRPHLKVILMSASVETNKFAKHFSRMGFSVGHCPPISGTLYPVKSFTLEDTHKQLQAAFSHSFPFPLGESSQYIHNEHVYSQSSRRPIEEDSESKIRGQQCDSFNKEEKKNALESTQLSLIPYELIHNLIFHICTQKKQGAILCFLPGWEEIQTLHRMLLTSTAGQQMNFNSPEQVQLHLLHSSVDSTTYQDSVFSIPKPGVRKIVLATNLGESSITISDVVYVIDSGKQKVMRYDSRTRANVLETRWISQANLIQRLGRAGRCQNGEYFLMMSQKRRDQLPYCIEPELLRSGLEELCLNLKALDVPRSLGDILDQAVDVPDKKLVREAVSRLVSLQALNHKEELTSLGRILAKFPLHPGISKMLVLAGFFNCVDSMITLVACLNQPILNSGHTPEENSRFKRLKVHWSNHYFSDHLTTLNMLRAYRDNPDKYQFCKENHISVPSLKKMDALRYQLHSLLCASGVLQANDPSIGNDRVQHKRQRHWKDGMPSLEILGTPQQNKNDLSIPLLRAILCAGMYPDVCRLKSRHLLMTKTLSRIMPGKFSVITPRRSDPPNFAPNATTGPALRSRPFMFSQYPKHFVFEILLRFGYSVIPNLTAVDPLTLLLFGNHVQPNRPNQHHPSNDSIQVGIDDWMAVAGPTEDLNPLLQFRILFSRFLNYRVEKIVQKSQSSLNVNQHQQEVEAMTNFIVDLFESGDIVRNSNVESLPVDGNDEDDEKDHEVYDY